MDDDNGSSNRPRNKSTSIIFCLLAVLLLYVLSPVPVGSGLTAAFPDQLDTISDVLDPVYAPLRWLYDNNSHAKAFYDWYDVLFEFGT